MSATAEYRARVPQRDRWLVSYADLMTLLFALFVVLVAAAYRKGGCALPRLGSAAGSSASRKSGQVRSASGVGRPESGSVAAAMARDAKVAEAAAAKERLYGALQQALALPSGAGNVSLQNRPEGIVISMKEAGYFETGQAMPLPAADALVDRIAQVVAPSGVQVRVEGHTDDQPINTTRFHSNWELSTARAEAVLQMLLAESGIDAGKLSVVGYGSYRPIADNHTEVGRRSNRRVDLVLLMPTGGA